MKPFIRKNIIIKIGSSSENHIVALVETKRVKTKDISKGENIFEAPEDGRFDSLPCRTNQERLSIFIEETKEINLGAPKNPHILHLAESLTPTEDPDFIKIFRKREINFAWSYADIPGVDP